MSWTLTAGVCVAFASSAVTLAIVAETEPFINEDGEEEYTLSGYLLLATAYVIKWPFKKLFELIKPRQIHDAPREEAKTETVESENEHELII